MAASIPSKITGGSTKKIFQATVLMKHQVSYYQCEATGFIQTEAPYWLAEAYAAAITKLDIGLIYRNLNVSDQFAKVIGTHFNIQQPFLDFAGGYGMFTRLMRDKGFDFYHTDIYCDNLFAKDFDLQLLPSNTRFEGVTAMEVFEHMVNPLEEIAAIFKYADNILFTTEVIPANLKGPLQEWWYFSFETGQHVSIYTPAALQHLAQQFGCNFYTNGSMLHLFTKQTFSSNPFDTLRDPFLVRKLKKWIKRKDQQRYHLPESKLTKDWKMIKDQLNQV